MLALPTQGNRGVDGGQGSALSQLQGYDDRPSSMAPAERVKVLISYEDPDSVDYVAVPYAKSQAPLIKINVDLMLVRSLQRLMP